MTIKSSRIAPGTKLRDADKMAHIPIKIVPSERKMTPACFYKNKPFCSVSV